jgi:molecular chaperone Hsp33
MRRTARFEPGRFQVHLLLGGGARALTVDMASSADEIRHRHKLGAHAARVAAEATLAGLLMSAHAKGEERVTLQVQAEAPPFSAFVDVRSDGSYRSRLSPRVLPAFTTFRGMIFVQKHDHERVLYQGVAPIEDTSFQGALQGYLVRSQQTLGKVRIGAGLGRGGHIAFATGLLVEKLPGLEDLAFQEALRGLEDRPIQELAREMEGGTLLGHSLETLEEREVRFLCTCSREKARGMLMGLGLPELAELREESGEGEMTCHFCGEVYRFPGDELDVMLDELRAEGRPPASEAP